MDSLDVSLSFSFDCILCKVFFYFYRFSFTSFCPQLFSLLASIHICAYTYSFFSFNQVSLMCRRHLYRFIFFSISFPFFWFIALGTHFDLPMTTFSSLSISPCSCPLLYYTIPLVFGCSGCVFFFYFASKNPNAFAIDGQTLEFEPI